MQIEHPPAGQAVGDDRLMNVKRALGRAGGAAGEMQQRPVVRGGEGDGKLIGLGVQQGVESMDTRFRAAVGEQHMFQIRQRTALFPHLALVQERSGDQHPRLALGQPHPHRLRAKGGKQRAKYRADFQCAQSSDVQFR